MASVQDQAQARVRAATHGRVQGADCQYSEGVLVLRGRARTFYSKQLAQEAVARLPGVVDVVNQIEVVSMEQSP